MNEPIDLYFVCVWPRAWLTLKPYPQPNTVLGTVRWRGQPVTVHLVTPDKIKIDKKKETSPPMYGLLKSNLQKQIRRQKVGAIATAAKMWELNKFELLRRLTIVSAEDAMIGTETATIVWLMAAKSKGLILTTKHKNWVMGYVQALVNVPTCLRLDIRNERLDLDPKLTPKDMLDSFHHQNEQLLAILFRCAYGGLSCDPPMLSRIIDYHLQQDLELHSLNVKPCSTIGPLKINPAAIDYHVWSDLVPEIIKRHSDLDSELLKHAIWECSSGVNKRNRIKRSVLKRGVWKRIKPDFDELGRGYLREMLKRHPLSFN